MNNTAPQTEEVKQWTYFPTSTVLTVDNYPYGYKKCKASFTVEFKKGKGYRTIFQTVNPSTGRVNAPKKSTYYNIVLMKQDQSGFVTYAYYSFNGAEQINKACKFIADKFDLFTPEQISDFYFQLVTFLRVELIASVQYGGSKAENIKPFIMPFVAIAVKGIKEGGNLFSSIVLDLEGMKATKPENFNPFTVSSEFIIGAEGIREVKL